MLRLALVRPAARIRTPLRARRLHIATHTIEHPTPDTLAPLLNSDATVFFALSTSLPPDALSPLVSAITAASSASVGSFSLADTPSLSLAVLTPEPGYDISCFYDPTKGRAPVQVGKWQRLGTSWTDDKRGAAVGELEAVLGGQGWEGVWRGEEGGGEVRLPESTRAILAFTDGTPQPLLSALEGYGAVKLGLVSAPTPFLTGRPHTLFHNGTAYSTGSVGVALSVAPKDAQVVYGIEPLDQEYTVSSARGNLLLSMDGAPNPTQALIAALQRRDAGKPRGEGLTKDEDFWLSIRDKDGGRAPQVVRILSGDPSRGALSVETEATLSAGQVVQFMHRPSAPPPILPLASCLRFATLPRVEGYVEPVSPGETRLKPGFLAASEDGFIYGAGKGAQAALCTVTGATVTARWWS